MESKISINFIAILIIMLMFFPTSASGLTLSSQNRTSSDDVCTDISSDNLIPVINKIIKLKEKNFSPKEILFIMNHEPIFLYSKTNPTFKTSLSDTFYTGYDQWTKLTSSEKWLIVLHPFKALETIKVSKLTFQYTEQEFNHNGLGDKSDAFRHALWNALLCKYIDSIWAEEITTAHEDKSTEELAQLATDGNLERDHRIMDLNNNREGRSCWYTSDSKSSTSDNILILRIHSKLNSGSLIILNP